jgi:hypothetical protein
MQVLGPSAIVIDAKALYDAAKKEHVHNFEDKRTGIEVMVLKEKLKASGTVWKWVSSERQYADGLTKMAARQLWADRLRATTICLRHDPDFVAAKKKDATVRRAEELKGASKAKIYMIETALRDDLNPPTFAYYGLACPYGFRGLRRAKSRARVDGQSSMQGRTDQVHLIQTDGAGYRRYTLAFLIAATQVMPTVSVKDEELELEEAAPIMSIWTLILIVFTLGFLLGVCCACRCRTAAAMGPRPRPTTSSSAAAAATEEQREPLLTRTSTTTEGSGAAAASASAGTVPTEPERLYPQMIYVTPAGTQYHIDGNCTGMARAKSIQTRYACLACIPAVDGDGTRHRSR